jgi:hypothetical protein
MHSRTTVGALVIALSLAGCMEAGVSDGDEAAAEQEGDGKADEFGIAMGTYQNAQPAVGAIVTLVLSPAGEGEELPSYYEGHYQLTEQRAEGSHEASGAFNVYNYAGATWIRFIDGDGFGTSYEKYSVVREEGRLVLRGHGAEASFTLEPVAAPQRLVTCTMTRLAVEGMPQAPGESISAALNPDEEDAYADSDDALEAFEGSYSFGISMYETSVDVIFYENEHVQDEVGSMGCDLSAAVPGVPFCQEPITIDASLGTEDETERSVDAFEFSCVLTVG